MQKIYLIFKEVKAKNVSEAIRKEKDGIIYNVQESSQPSENVSSTHAIGFEQLNLEEDD